MSSYPDQRDTAIFKKRLASCVRSNAQQQKAVKGTKANPQEMLGADHLQLYVLEVTKRQLSARTSRDSPRIGRESRPLLRRPQIQKPVQRSAYSPICLEIVSHANLKTDAFLIFLRKEFNLRVLENGVVEL